MDEAIILRSVLEFESPFLSAIYTRGHHSTDEFLDALMHSEFAKGMLRPPRTQVKQGHLRFVPGRDSDELIVVFDCAPGRGAFAATWCEAPFEDA